MDPSTVELVAYLAPLRRLLLSVVLLVTVVAPLVSGLALTARLVVHGLVDAVGLRSLLGLLRWLVRLLVAEAVLVGLLAWQGPRVAEVVRLEERSEVVAAPLVQPLRVATALVALRPLVAVLVDAEQLLVRKPQPLDCLPESQPQSVLEELDYALASLYPARHGPEGKEFAFARA